MQVLWTERAQRDFDEVTAYIAEGSAHNAMLVRSRILQASRLLGTTPFIGTTNPRDGNRDWLVSRTGFILRYRIERKLCFDQVGGPREAKSGMRPGR